MSWRLEIFLEKMNDKKSRKKICEILRTAILQNQCEKRRW